MSIRTKMLLGFSMMILLFLLSIGTSLYLENQRTQMANQVDARQSTLIMAMSLIDQVRTVDNSGAYYLLATKSDDKNTYQNKYYDQVTGVTNALEQLQKASTSAQDKKDMDEFAAAWDSYTKSNDVSFQLAYVGGVVKAQAAYVDVPFDTVVQSLQSYATRHQKEIGALQTTMAHDEQMASLISYAVVGLGVVLGLVIALILAGRITAPLRKVNAQLKEIAEGEGDLTRTLSVSSKDEVGDLALSFNQMMSKLRDLIRDVGDHAQQVASSSVELSASAEQTGRATEHIAAAIQEVAAGADNQVASISESTRTIDEMSHVMQEISESAQSVANSAIEASQLAQEGNNAIQTAVTRMDAISGTVSELDVAVRGLGQRSQEIGQIVEVITAIAAQTNLLALNAAIEAARAGEAGRGFAVVADEVRKLAEQSSESAQQIAGLIETIQADTQRAVLSMSTGIEEVASGSEAVQVAGASFEQILYAVDRVAGQIEDVSAASQEMAASTSLVVDSINQVAEISAASQSGTQNVSAATEEQLASMQEITATASSLSKLAEELQDLVGRFQV